MAPVRHSPPSSSASSRASTSSSSSHGGSCLGISSSSHPIAAKKKQPIIRVVHVFAPTLIKTDPANFRALVQRLTGNKAPKGAAKDMGLHHTSVDNFCEANYVSDYHKHAANHEEIRILESSKQPKKKINRSRKSSFSAALGPAAMTERKTLLYAQDAAQQNGLDILISSEYNGLARTYEGDNPGLVNYMNDSDGDANLANYFELARPPADDIMDGCFACDADAYTDYNGSSPSSNLGGSTYSSWNTESPRSNFEETQYAFDDEGLEVMGSFNHQYVSAPHHLMQLNPSSW
ncbi:hypothetical protein GOP47_0003382 [Adiantum capillus-veneris]|uniref:VQ domain-containing protein n=1 Tax=Adiantum capillus-veneris TaxID=13818 RepID=A0A9D4VC51_ADICA|nr:hypothetical protein GOP47_0003382 [Adiantum capillus-veneris]